ncbi:MAG TPA: FAD/NAD(P)-binding oxidoreductase [Chloroflexota bacterium]|nr:FAD/NAD(P)-binding oxidoreductase [Chloroflexota bacterium]
MTAESHRSGRRIVIAGGSFAGLGAAFTLRQFLPTDDRVTVVEPSGQFVFAPSLIWAALGRPLIRSSFALEPTLSAKGIEHVRSHVRRVDLDRRLVETDDDSFAYDKLLICTGGRPSGTGIPGIAEASRSNSFVAGLDSAEEVRWKLRALFSDPGPVVIGCAQEAGYHGAMYELALAIDCELRRQGVRDRAPLTFITSEPYLGHLGFGHPAARAKFEELFRERDITWRAGVALEAVRRDEVALEGGELLPAKAVFIMPPFSGAVDVWKSQGLTDERGFVPVDEQYRHPEHHDVYAAGVASLFTHAVPPLAERRAPHTGYLSIRMGKTAAQNIGASLGYATPASRPLPYLVDVRIIDGGDAGLLLTSRGTLELSSTATRLDGQLAHTLKSGVERYLTWRLRTGRIELP